MLNMHKFIKWRSHVKATRAVAPAICFNKSYFIRKFIKYLIHAPIEISTRAHQNLDLNKTRNYINIYLIHLIFQIYILIYETHIGSHKFNCEFETLLYGDVYRMYVVTEPR
jgi:hypothetical protein